MDPQRVRLVVIAAAVALVAVVGIASMGGGTKGDGKVVISMKTPATGKPTPRPVSSGLSINALLNQTPVPSATATLPPVTRDPRGAQDAMVKADMAYTTGNLFEARKQYKAAVRLDPQCESCAQKLETLEKKMVQEINDAMTAGERYMETGRYDQAIWSFERVIDLDPDKSSAFNMNASRLIEEAKAKKLEGRR